MRVGRKQRRGSALGPRDVRTHSLVPRSHQNSSTRRGERRSVLADVPSRFTEQCLATDNPAFLADLTEAVSNLDILRGYSNPSRSTEYVATDEPLQEHGDGSSK